jgi:predicted GNAT family acetyltransferase
MEFLVEPGRLWHETDGVVDAQILFPAINDGKTWSIDSAVVAPDLRGQGIASEMLDQVVQMAKAEGVTLRPICSFARTKFFVTPEYQALQAK